MNRCHRTMSRRPGRRWMDRFAVRWIMETLGRELRHRPGFLLQAVSLGPSMQVLTFDWHAHPSSICDMGVPLRRLAQSHDRVIAARWQRLLELIEFLRPEGPDRIAWGRILQTDLMLWPEGRRDEIKVFVRMDWQDYAPLRNGLPRMHYRLQIKRESAALSEDARVPAREQVQRIIWDAFDWSR